MRINLALVSALLLGTSPGFANAIHQSQGATLNDVGNSFAVPVEFNRFDPTLGALTQVTLSLEANFSGTVGIENTSGSPDVASGIIAGSVTVSTNGNSLSVEVFPDAQGPVHHFTAFDGALDYSGSSGATDTVSGADLSASVTAPPPASALQLFIGSQPIFLTLDATSFPIAGGQETESVTETANASALVNLTYDYTPASSVPEPGTLVLGTIGVTCLLGKRRWRGSANLFSASGARFGASASVAPEFLPPNAAATFTEAPHVAKTARAAMRPHIGCGAGGPKLFPHLPGLAENRRSFLRRRRVELASAGAYGSPGHGRRKDAKTRFDGDPAARAFNRAPIVAGIRRTPGRRGTLESRLRAKAPL